MIVGQYIAESNSKASMKDLKLKLLHNTTSSGKEFHSLTDPYKGRIEK